jgi:hypothetical protein
LNVMDTLYLDPDSWDLVLDASGNIAMASPPYALAQDAASAIRTFIGEAYYNTELGIPYFEQVLGKYPSLEFLKAELVTAALTVPGIIAARVFISGVLNRQVTGQVQITDSSGVVTAAGF